MWGWRREALLRIGVQFRHGTCLPSPWLLPHLQGSPGSLCREPNCPDCVCLWCLSDVKTYAPPFTPTTHPRQAVALGSVTPRAKRLFRRRGVGKPVSQCENTHCTCCPHAGPPDTLAPRPPTLLAWCLAPLLRPLRAPGGHGWAGLGRDVWVQGLL